MDQRPTQGGGGGGGLELLKPEPSAGQARMLVYPYLTLQVWQQNSNRARFNFEIRDGEVRKATQFCHSIT